MMWWWKGEERGGDRVETFCWKYKIETTKKSHANRRWLRFEPGTLKKKAGSLG